MKIKFEKYNLNWSRDFEKLKDELSGLLELVNPQIEHIGSTSVEGLSAKPIIDILIGLDRESDLNKVITPLTDKGYVYYEIFNKEMPYRRFFIKHQSGLQDPVISKTITDRNTLPESTEEHSKRLAHIHILPYKSEHWIRHIAFRDYLRAHRNIKNEYQNLKEELSKKEWRDGNEYNAAKNQFIKEQESKAVDWYKSRV